MNLISDWKAGVLDPHGPIAAAQYTILINATVIMLAVIVPIIVATLAIAWWFREGNAGARRRPQWAYSGPVEVTVWSIPLLVILFLGGIAWLGAHDLDPSRPIASKTTPLEIQVISLDWKWLFIYPGQNIASVNRLVVPAGVPLRLRLTSAGVMNSFFVPQLGSQIYTMAGMTTTLNLQADKPGTYAGLSAQFSGDGFSDMRFTTVALSQSDFDHWRTLTQGSGNTLDAASYAALTHPGTVPTPYNFGSVAPKLFDTALKLATPNAAPSEQCNAEPKDDSRKMTCLAN